MGHPVRFLWPPATKHLLVTTRWDWLGNRWEWIGFTIQLAPGQRVRRLQRNKDIDILKMGELVDHALGLLKEELEKSRHLDALDPETRDAPPNPRSAPDALPSRRGRPPVPLETLKEVAEVYKGALRNDPHPQPIRSRAGALR